MARDQETDLHAQILELLLDKVRTDPYPSTTMLDMVEGMLRDEDVDDYASVLMDKVSRDAFPSIDHLRRLLAFA
jgi:hypothetical protein